MERLSGEDIEQKASAVNVIVQGARTPESLTDYLTRHQSKAVLLAVADLNHLDVHSGQRPESIVKAIVADRFPN